MPDGATKTADVHGIAGDRLRSFIERIERLEAEKRALGEDIKAIYADAKATGFDPKIMRKIVALRSRDKDEIDEENTMLDLYCQALGMLPLFEAAEATKPATPKENPALRRAVKDFVDGIPADTEVSLGVPGGNKMTIAKDKAGKVTRADVVTH